MAKPELGKYLLWTFFRKSAKVRPYLPDTRRYSADNLQALLSRYGVVYVKPVAGSRGRGIIKVWRQNQTIYAQHTIRSPQTFRSLQAAVRYIDRLRGGKAYLVQQGIQLATIGGKPFDIRVMMQREAPGGKWLHSGMLAKVAGAHSVVTNVALSRGTVMEASAALRKALGWNELRVRRCVREILNLSFAAARHFDSYQPYRELGFDIAVDKTGRIWMLEENTGPSHQLFAHLKSNLSMYRTIQNRWSRFQRLRKGGAPAKRPLSARRQRTAR